jgi:tetratricopeptide (TPR) repeat protein
MHSEALDRARAEFEHGETFKARAILESALVERDDAAALRLALAAVVLQDGDLEAGLLHLDYLREHAPWSPVVEAYTAGALLGLGRASDAKDIIDEAFARAPRDFYVLLKRGELYCRLGVYSTAVEALECALRIGADDHLAREAAHRLLRFARKKVGGSFVRTFRAPAASAVRKPWRALLGRV